MAFADYDKIRQPLLALPIRGKTYEIPEPDAETGIKLALLRDQSLKAAQGETVTLPDFDDDTEADLYRMTLGDAYQQMLDDKVPYSALKLAGVTAFIDFSMGREAAEALWAGGGAGPKAPTPPNRKARRATATRTRTAAANTTRKPASASGTSSPKGNSPAKKPSSEASPGDSPSNAGPSS